MNAKKLYEFIQFVQKPVVRSDDFRDENNAVTTETISNKTRNTVDCCHQLQMFSNNCRPSSRKIPAYRSYPA